MPFSSKSCHDSSFWRRRRTSRQSSVCALRSCRRKDGAHLGGDERVFQRCMHRETGARGSQLRLRLVVWRLPTSRSGAVFRNQCCTVPLSRAEMFFAESKCSYIVPVPSLSTDSRPTVESWSSRTVPAVRSATALDTRQSVRCSPVGTIEWSVHYQSRDQSADGESDRQRVGSRESDLVYVECPAVRQTSTAAGDRRLG